MTSFSAYFTTWYTWWFFKGSFQTTQGLHNRIKRERGNNGALPTDAMRRKFIVEERQVDGFPVFDVSPKSEAPSRARVLYLHGGAFLFPITPVHWAFIAALAERLQAVVTVPRYPLGPGHSLRDMYAFLQPLHDEMAAATNDTPFWLMGDSAGATLSIGLSQAALLAGKPVAARMVLVTPCVDCTLTNPDVPEVVKSDPWMDIPGIREIPRIICPDLEPTDPLVSPIYGDLGRLPPMLVFAAARDLLTPDTKLFAEKAKAKGCEVVLVEGPGMLHVWPILPIPEAADAVDRIVEFLA